MKAVLHDRETRRLEALRSYGILDTPRESDFDDVVALASRICETPIAVINLIDSGRQWFKAEVGLGVRETPLDTSLCAHAILQPGVFEVPDTLEDDRFSDNPLCTGEPHLRFYTGALLETGDGMPIGTLCVLDHRPRRLNDLQKTALAVLARQVMNQIELRRSLRDAELMMQEMDHRVKNSLALVSGILNLQARRAKTPELRAEVEIARDRVGAIANLHEQLHQASRFDRVNMAEFLDRLLGDLRRTTGERIRLRSEVAPVYLDPRRAATLGVLVNELVTNALRHAFPEGRGGEVLIRFETGNGGAERLLVEDDGIGIAEINGAAGLGTLLIDRLATQLRGTVARERLARGTRITLDLAPAGA